MARINLLPWRKEQRERKNREFNFLAGATAGLAILVAALAFTFLNRELSNQQAANKHVEDANAQLDVALKSIADLEEQRTQMLEQMKVIQDLQGRRSVPVRVWDDMAKAIPSTMYLNSIKREGDVITLVGKAANPNIVANLVRNLNASEWLDATSVVSIKSTIEAYQSKVAQPTDQAERAVLPEDSYIEFEVTTKVQDPMIEQAQTDNQEEVILPPVADGTVPIPEVATIGIDNAPSAAVASSSAAPVGQQPASAATTVNNSSAKSGSSSAPQPVASNTKAGGQ